jgi:hypothetical protein
METANAGRLAERQLMKPHDGLVKRVDGDAFGGGVANAKALFPDANKHRLIATNDFQGDAWYKAQFLEAKLGAAFPVDFKDGGLAASTEGI